MKYLVLSERPEALIALSDALYNDVENTLDFLRDETLYDEDDEGRGNIAHAWEIWTFLMQNNVLRDSLVGYDLVQVESNLRRYAKQFKFDLEDYTL